MTVDEWRARYEQLEVETKRLRAERDAAWAEAAELQALFGLQRTRMDAARALWQEAHPEKENVWPDLGDLLAWLMQERAVAKTFSRLDRAALAAAQAEAARAVEALAAIRNHLGVKAQQHEDEVSNDFSSGESHGWRMAHWQVLEMSKEVNARSALDWLAQQRQEAVAAWIEKEATKCRQQNGEYYDRGVDCMLREAAALRAGGGKL